MKKVVLITATLLALFLVLTTRVWYEEKDPLGTFKPLPRVCIHTLGQRIVVLIGEDSPDSGFEYYGRRGARLHFALWLRPLEIVVFGDPSWYWGCPMVGVER